MESFSGVADGFCFRAGTRWYRLVPAGTRIFLQRTRRAVPETHSAGGITAVLWYPHDSGMFFTGGSDRTVRVWDAAAMCPVFSCQVAGIVHQLAMSPLACATPACCCGLFYQ
eukprot:TRINITY_DN7833_c0_g1_i11.p7 TRINITY_DN7833_c0_g1~~TRINITY_DN7833_c0_g1_i11.p7  ORF type:complete len:112 (-),score=14.71 TRINITY_DN7833_c0_g1_i11:1831-2166(-)